MHLYRSCWQELRICLSPRRCVGLSPLRHTAFSFPLPTKGEATVVHRQPFHSSSAQFVKRTSISANYPPFASRIVLLRHLPETATPDDVRRIANDPKLADQIDRIEFFRSVYLRFTGKALLYFSTENHAIAFQQAASEKMVGGNLIEARRINAFYIDNLIRSHYFRFPKSLALPLDLIPYDSGKLVLLEGLPAGLQPFNLEKLLGRYDLRKSSRWRGKKESDLWVLQSNYGIDYSDKYRDDHINDPSNDLGNDLGNDPGNDPGNYPSNDHNNDHNNGKGNRKGKGSHGVPVSHWDLELGPVVRVDSVHQDATTASFLVRLTSTQEAMNLVRRWHNTYFSPHRYNIEETGGRFRVVANMIY